MIPLCTFDEHDLCRRHGVRHDGALRAFALGVDERSQKYRRWWDQKYADPKKRTPRCTYLGRAVRDESGKATYAECREG